MNVNELRAKIESMPPDDFLYASKGFGGANNTRDGIIQTFIDYPEFERKLAHYFGLKTEADKITEAAIASVAAAEKSAAAAELSAKSSANAATWTKWASVAAMLSAIIAAIATGIAYRESGQINGAVVLTPAKAE